MHRSFGIAAACAALISLALPARAGAAEGYRISGPFVHANLAIYFVHGPSASGPVPLTLQEALAQGVVKVHETGSVNELAIENLGNEEVFVQSGDIVKGGQQDRVLMVSLIVPPHSGRMPIASFCVEHDRWTGRGREDARTFASSNSVVPSRAAKLAMKAPTEANPAPRGPHAIPGDMNERQRRVWADVATTQSRLSGALGLPVASPQSRSSLQLALENEKLQDALRVYVGALQGAGEKDDDVVGYVFAINGKLNSADVYPSNGLFRKMWAKLLTASAIEAIGSQDAGTNAPPAIEAVTAFLDGAEHGKVAAKDLTRTVRLETRDGDQALFFETQRAAGGWVHRNYLAK